MNILQKFTRDYCYTKMENRGIAVFGCCSGLVGGDKFSDYVQYKCINCPYFVDVSREKSVYIKE